MVICWLYPSRSPFLNSSSPVPGAFHALLFELYLRFVPCMEHNSALDRLRPTLPQRTLTVAP